MLTATRLSKKDIPSQLLNIFPDYKGRTSKVYAATTYAMADYWDGGSRQYCKAVNLRTSQVGSPATIINNPMNKAAHSQIEIPEGVVIAEHSIFCGKDCGITFYVNPANMPKNWISKQQSS